MRALASTASVVAFALLAASSEAQDHSASNAFGSDGSGPTETGGDTTMPPSWAWPTAAPSGSSYRGWHDSSYHFDSSSSTSSASFSSDSSSSGSYNGTYGDEQEVGIEFYYPEIDGAVNRMRRSKYPFDPIAGFSLTTVDASTGAQPGNCSMHSYCVHVVFESDYGAMSVFDAFYLDSYESSSGPIGTDSFTVGGPAPLVLGRFPPESIDRLGANWSQVFNWNDSRRTAWTFFPTSGSPQDNEIDLTLSLKQVYTALPDFSSQYADRNNTGPLYSSDLTDQVVIRLNTFVANEYTSTSGMLPIVVNHTGSQLMDINITATRLFSDAHNDSNEIQLTVKIGRRKYGGIAPWIPVRASQCFSLPSWFTTCLEANNFRLRWALVDLLSYNTFPPLLNMRVFVELCAKPLRQSKMPDSSSSGSWTGDSSRSGPFAPMDAGSRNGEGSSSDSPPSPTGGGSWNGEGSSSDSHLSPTAESSNGGGDGWAGFPEDSFGDPLRELDDALRVMSYGVPRCAWNDITMKTDGQAIALHYEPATTRIDFGVSSFSFYLVIEVDDQTVTTHVFTSGMSEMEIADEIHSELALGRQWLRLSVNFANNMEEVEDARRQNRWMMEAYEDALRWSRTSASSQASGSNGDSSVGSDSELPTGSSTSESSGDGSGSWNAGDNGGSFADVHSPKQPRLVPVPAEKYSVLIRFENHAIAPRVRYVYSNVSDMAFTIDEGKLQLEATPFLQADARYTPPPAELDLEWRDEPLWKSQARRLLRKLPMGDSCSKCTKAFERCLLNEDCAFGVNSYFGEAMRWDRWANQTSNTSNAFDVSDATRQARQFFPGKGFEKLQGLLLCWANSKCDLSEPPAPVFNESSGVWEKPRSFPTVFEFKPSTLELSVLQSSRFAIFYDGDKQYSDYGYCYSYSWNPQSYWSSQNFLSNILFQAEPTYVRSISFQIDCSSGGSSPNRYALTWPSGFVEPLQVDARDDGYSSNTQASSQASPWTLKIVTPDSVDDDTQSPWPRLESWLGLFRSVPFGLSIGSLNATNGTNTTDWTPNSTVLPVSPPSSPSAVCPACAGLLMGCISNSACATAARTWLNWVLPAGSFNSTDDWDGFTRLRWLGKPFSNDSISEEFREPLLNFVACLSKYKCAVGYSKPSSYSNMTVPTIVRLRVNRKVALPMWTGNTLVAYGNLPPVVLQNRDDVQTFTDQIRAATDEDVGGYWGNDMSSGNFLNLTGSPDVIRQIRLVGNKSRIASQPDIYSVRFQSPTPTEPSWSYLLSWFGIESRPSDTQCSACMPKLRECYFNSFCWQQIQDHVMPVLERKRGWIQQSYEFISDGHARYKAEIGSEIFNYYDSNNGGGSGPLTDLIAILKCFAVAKCDVSTMDSAVEPPATAYVPSYVTFERAYMRLFLYPDTTISVYGMQYSHTGSISDLETFLHNAFSGRNLPFTILSVPSNDYSDGPGMMAYNVTFGEDVFSYSGGLPYINVIGSGQKPASESRWYRDPWAYTNPSRVFVVSMNQWPQWDGLMSLLSVPPMRDVSNATSVSMVGCEAAQQAKQDCFQDFNCQFDLSYRFVQRLQGALLKAPSYNPSSGLFEMDLSAAIQATGSRTEALLVQWALCAANGTAATHPTFARGSAKLECPLDGQLYIQGWWGSTSFNQDISEDEFQQYIANYNHGGLGTRTKTETTNVYELELTGTFGVCPVTLSWTNDTTGERLESTCMPRLLGFQSESFDMYEAALPWLKWLTTF